MYQCWSYNWGKSHFKAKNTPMGVFDADREFIYLTNDQFMMMSDNVLA